MPTTHPAVGSKSMATPPSYSPRSRGMIYRLHTRHNSHSFVQNELAHNFEELSNVQKYLDTQHMHLQHPTIMSDAMVQEERAAHAVYQL